MVSVDGQHSDVSTGHGDCPGVGAVWDELTPKMTCSRLSAQCPQVGPCLEMAFANVLSEVWR